MDNTQHFRRDGRQPLALKVDIRHGHATDVHHFQGELTDLSMGGAFLQCDEALRIGTVLTLTVSAATSWEPINIEAEVRWISNGKKDQPSGVGLNFLPLGSTEATALYDLLQVIGYDANQTDEKP